MRCPLRTALAALFLSCPAWAQTATAPASQPDLSTPKAALTAAYESLKAGDLSAARACLAFKNDAEAELFDITFSQLYTPLKLMHAMEARFGAGRGQLFANAPLERELETTLAQARNVEIRITGEAAEVVDKKAAVNPSHENQLTGIQFVRQDGKWKIVAATFTDVADGGDMPAPQLAMMRLMRSAVETACQATGERLARGEFKTAEETYADYQARIQVAMRAAMQPPPATQK